MIVPEPIKTFLATRKYVRLGDHIMEFFYTGDIAPGKERHRLCLDGNIMTIHEVPGWKNNWCIIGADDMGEYIFADTDVPGMPVYISEYQEATEFTEGEYIPKKIAGTLRSFAMIVDALSHLSKRREHPVDLLINPIRKDKREVILARIEQIDPGVYIDFWEDFMSDHFFFFGPPDDFGF